MLKQQSKLFNKIAMALDTVSILLAFFAAYYFVQYCFNNLEQYGHYGFLLLLATPVLLFLISYFGIYSSLRTKSYWYVLSNLFKVYSIGLIIISASVFLIYPHGFSRIFLFTFIIVSFAMTLSVKVFLKLFLNYLRRKGYNVRHILIVGSGERLNSFVSLIQKHKEWGLILSGIVTLCNEKYEIEGSRHLGNLSELETICKSSLVDEVVFTINRTSLELLDDYISMLLEMGITVRMVIDFYDIPTVNSEISLFHGKLPMLTFYSKSFDAGALFLKRCLDIVGSMIGLAMTFCLFPFIATAIRIESPGPVFFGQKRVGENGRLFKCWKFRSMFIDAEARKKDLMAQNEMQGAMFKMADDPRVTKVGKFIRKTSLDELPQFWNVFKGEMSLVGTRPPTPDEVATYENWHRKRICIKPGITGLWQVSGRNQIQDFDDVVRLDIQYIESWSLWLDIKLLFKTVLVVFARKGAA